MTPITPHPLATWVQMQVSPQRHEIRRRRRRRVARILAAREAASSELPATARPAAPTVRPDRAPRPAAAPPRVPVQRRPADVVTDRAGHRADDRAVPVPQRGAGTT